jgi:cyclophilin family peptidyl-prolyl cis-trans isomerase
MFKLPLLLGLLGLACLWISQTPDRTFLLNPEAPEMNQRAPEVSGILLDTSKGRIVLELRRAWSPHGADRFYNLVRHGYYDDARFFRVRPARWVQFGIAADPKVATAWRTRTIPDDPRVVSNARGTVAYAFKDPNGRTTQVFINLKDNASTHDGEPFVPFACVIEGMAAADALYSDYGENGGSIRGGKQDPIFAEGNAFFLREFPKLDYIRRATTIP